jgi:hypothetical protein
MRVPKYFSFTLTKQLTMPRPQRTRKPTIKKRAAEDIEEAVSQICALVIAKKRKKSVLQPIAVEPQATRELRRENLPDYQPPLRLYKFESRPRFYP